MSLFVTYKSRYEITFTVYYYGRDPEKITGICETNNKNILYPALHENYSIFRDFAGIKINRIKKLEMLNV